MKLLLLVLNMLFMSLLFSSYVLADSQPFSCWGTPQKTRKRFDQEHQTKQANIEVRWTVVEAKRVQRTTRAMWEESEGALLFSRIKPEQFVY